MSRINNKIKTAGGTTLLLGLLAIVTFTAFFFSARHELVPIHRFTVKYLGYSAYVLIPMTITLFSAIIHLAFVPLRPESPWYNVLAMIETTGPIIGILGTFIAIGIGLAGLSAEQLNGTGILGIAAQIGSATWNSVVGLTLGMIAHVVRVYVAKG